MDDKKCECKLDTKNPVPASGCVVIYELTIIIILLILILINSNELIEKVNLIKAAQPEAGIEE